MKGKEKVMEWVEQNKFLVLLLIAIVVGLPILYGIAMRVLRFYIKVDQGHALIINPMTGDPRVTFTGGIVWPVVYRGEVMDISLKTIEIDRRGVEGLICQDNI